RAVLTIPRDGGRYHFGGGLQVAPNRHEVPMADLEIDADFDPRHINGGPEPVDGRKAVRLRDAAGRTATVQGAEVMVEAGQAVLRFHAQPIPTAEAVALRGAAVDEAGKPLEGVKFTAAFYSGSGGAMSHLVTTTDARGKFEVSDLLLPQSYFD